MQEQLVYTPLFAELWGSESDNPHDPAGSKKSCFFTSQVVEGLINPTDFVKAQKVWIDIQPGN